MSENTEIKEVTETPSAQANELNPIEKAGFKEFSSDEPVEKTGEEKLNDHLDSMQSVPEAGEKTTEEKVADFVSEMEAKGKIVLICGPDEAATFRAAIAHIEAGESLEVVPTDEQIIEYLRESNITLDVLPENTQMLVEGSRLFLADKEVVLKSAAMIEWNDSEMSFAGHLAMSNNLARNAAELKLKYDANGGVLPIAAQCAPENVCEFVAGLALEEAYAAGVNPNDYDAFCRTHEAAQAAETLDNLA